jgi:acyl-CoA synthetase (AMP-forming)/AMP-acid ligase II
VPDASRWIGAPLTGTPAAASLAPPPIVFRQRLWSASEIAGMAVAHWDALRTVPASSQLTAMVMANHPEAIALFFALSACQAPLLLLAPEPRSWRTSPPVPHGTRLVLTPAFAHLERQATDLGLSVRAAPAPAIAARDRALPFLTCPGLVLLTSGSTGVPRPVYRGTSSLIAAGSALAGALCVPEDAGVIAALPLDRAYGLNTGLMVATVLQRPVGLLERFVHGDMLSLCQSGTYWYWAGTPVMADILSRSQLPGPVRMPPMCSFAGGLSASVCQAFRRDSGRR